MDKQVVFSILNSEMELATGCTEPAAIALAAADAGIRIRNLGEEVLSLAVSASVNIIKNAMAAGIPGTSYTGIEYASALGATGGNPDDKLLVLDKINPKSYQKAEALVKSGNVKLSVSKAAEVLYIDIVAKSEHHVSHSTISQSHTNIVLREFDGIPLSLGKETNQKQGVVAVTPEMISQNLSIARIFHFIDEEMHFPEDRIPIIGKSIKINSAISMEGMKNPYGLETGRTLEQVCKDGFKTMDMSTQAIVDTTAGVDARMAGAPYPVVTNSGSGNQGITATMPVVSVAKWLKIPEEKMFRAVTLSNLMAIYIKSHFGRLSALCGATVASIGAACGITYLFGGGLTEINNTIQNMIGNLTGMVCDGAKADCAFKVSSCVNAAIQSSIMAMKGIRVKDTDGIVEDDAEKTLRNFTDLGVKGSAKLDEIILQMLLDKNKQ
ncbi:MAG: L-serine ammonia-lyase, iron-sulfur-dependent, subunit alpha [Sphaerochaetaceae bacterium]